MHHLQQEALRMVELSCFQQAGVRQAGVQQSGVQQSGVHQAGVQPAGVHQAGVHQSLVQQSPVRQSRVPQQTSVSIGLGVMQQFVSTLCWFRVLQSNSIMVYGVLEKHFTSDIPC
jgi:hypothetical protein